MACYRDIKIAVSLYDFSHVHLTYRRKSIITDTSSLKLICNSQYAVGARLSLSVHAKPHNERD